MIGLDNNPYDFFGVRKKKVKSLSYLGLGMPVVRKKGSNPSFVNLIGNPKPFTAKPIHTQKMDYWGKALYRKESTKQKRLSKWGDADMDGSPNYFDCDPVNWLKDKKKVNPKKLNKFTGATVTSAEDVKSMGKQIAKDVASGTTIVRRVGRRRLTREEKISKEVDPAEVPA